MADDPKAAPAAATDVKTAAPQKASEPAPGAATDAPAQMTADEARAKLVKDGANMLPEEKATLQHIASGRDLPRASRPTQAMSPWGGGSSHQDLLVEFAGRPDEAMVEVSVPRLIRLVDAGRMLRLEPGVRAVPVHLVQPQMHPYLEANGVRTV